MRRAQTVILGLVLGLISGCTSGPYHAGHTIAPTHHRILSQQEWVRQNYPEVTRQPFLSPTMREHIIEGYKLYLEAQALEIHHRFIDTKEAQR